MFSWSKHKKNKNTYRTRQARLNQILGEIMDTNAKTDVSYYLELKQELTALRAWKAKARPFLEEELRCFTSELEYNSVHPSNIEEWETKKATLTELLGGSDE